MIAPTKVVLDQHYEAVPLRLASDCLAADMDSAAWSVDHPTEGPSGGFIFGPDQLTDIWNLYEWDGPAQYTVRPGYAYDSNFDDITQNTAYISVKLGSRLTATTARSNGVLTFSAYASTYSPNVSGWYKRAGANVSLMYLAPGASTWTYVKYAVTDSSGRARLSVAPKYGSYRLMIKETEKVWAGYSTIVRGK